MKSVKIFLSVILAAAGAHATAAEPVREFGGGRIEIQAQGPRSGDTQRQPERDFRRAERPPDRGQRPDGRLTEEERRGLRRDIDRANREIYKGWRRP